MPLASPAFFLFGVHTNPVESPILKNFSCNPAKFLRNLEQGVWLKD
jgi:hypothetical protein